MLLLRQGEQNNLLEWEPNEHATPREGDIFAQKQYFPPFHLHWVSIKACHHWPFRKRKREGGRREREKVCLRTYTSDLVCNKGMGRGK